MRGKYLREYITAYVENFTSPTGRRVAVVQRYPDRRYISIISEFPGIESRRVQNETELDDSLNDIEDEHYRLTTDSKQRRRDRLDKWVEHPIVKLIGIVAAIVAATASVRGCMN